MKKKIIIAVALVVVCLASIGFGVSRWKTSQKVNPKEMMARIENILGDEYKKQTMTEIIATLCYADKAGNEINYHVLKTTYYEATPSEVTGLNVAALSVLFTPDCADSFRELIIQEWNGGLYELGERSYLCWTCSPEISYILEYNPEAVSDDEIIKMAESAKPLYNE